MATVSSGQGQGEDIAALLGEAQADLDALRFTAPAGDNALEKYRKALEFAPDNTTARQGLQNIADRLVGLGEQASAAGDRDKAADYLQQAEAIVPGAPKIALAKPALKIVAGEREAVEAKEKQDRAEAVLRAVDAALAQDDAASALARLEEARQAGVDEAVLADRRRRLRDRVETLAALAGRDAEKACKRRIRSLRVPRSNGRAISMPRPWALRYDRRTTNRHSSKPRRNARRRRARRNRTRPRLRRRCARRMRRWPRTTPRRSLPGWRRRVRRAWTPPS